MTNETTGAIGPFQFMPSTWAGLVVQHGQQEDIAERDIVKADKQAVFAAIHTAEAQDQLLGKLGLPTGVELYVAHRLGLPQPWKSWQPTEQCPLIERFCRFFKGRRTQQGPSDT